MKKIFLYLTLYLFTVTVYGCKSNSNPSDGNGGTDSTGMYKLVWSDEFNYSGLPDTTKWGYDVGGSGWGNHEEQYYTYRRLSNARVEDSILVIEARQEYFGGKKYTSARLISTGKGDWTYGKFEIRARLPHGIGTWPALWMLPTEWTYGDGGWPDNGEIDIMEHVGYDPNVIHGSIHCRAYYWRENTQKTAVITVPTALQDFHVYSMEWTADQITMYVDSTKYFTFNNEHLGWEKWPFDKKFHFLFNIAVGGDWGGQKGIDDSIFPQKMEIDYVRVYKK